MTRQWTITVDYVQGQGWEAAAECDGDFYAGTGWEAQDAATLMAAVARDLTAEVAAVVVHRRSPAGDFAACGDDSTGIRSDAAHLVNCMGCVLVQSCW